jgi:hypothetical protein
LRNCNGRTSYDERLHETQFHLAYDALHRRIVTPKTTGSSNVPIDIYYNVSWQVLEEREGGNAKASYVWSPVYPDAMVARDRDADARPAKLREGRGRARYRRRSVRLMSFCARAGEGGQLSQIVIFDSLCG